MKVLPLQSSFSFFPKTGFALPGLLVFVLFFVFFILHINFKIRLSISVKKTCWDFDKDGVDAIGQFGGDLPSEQYWSPNLWTRNVSIYSDNLSFPSAMFCRFQCTGHAVLIRNLFLFYSFCCYRAELFFLISFSDGSSPVCRNVIDFCTLILYPTSFWIFLLIIRELSWSPSGCLHRRTGHLE